MSSTNKATKARNQVKLARLEIVAQLYKRGYSIRQIVSEVMKRLDVDKYSVSTCHRDIQTLLSEWRDNRIDNMDYALQLELERIDDTIRELWSQWDKSKEDQRRVGASKKTKNGGVGGEECRVENSSTTIVGLGNPAYMTEIRQQLTERRKLLGLYAPERRDITGDVTLHRPPSEMSTEEIEAEIEALKLNS